MHPDPETDAVPPVRFTQTSLEVFVFSIRRKFLEGFAGNSWVLLLPSVDVDLSVNAGWVSALISASLKIQNDSGDQYEHVKPQG